MKETCSKLVCFVGFFHPPGENLPIEKRYTDESRLTIVSHEAKKKQAVRDERVSYLQVAPL